MRKQAVDERDAGQAFVALSAHSVGREREPQLFRKLLCRSDALLSLFLEPLERRSQGRGRSSLEELAGRRAQEPHVSHARHSGEHDVQVQPPLVVRSATVAALFLPGTVKCGAFAQGLALRRCGTQE